jgi:hypothetical protein
MNSDLPPLEDLNEHSETIQFESLQIGLELCQSFIELAKTEHQIGDPSGVLQARSKAETRYESVSRLMANLKDPVLRQKIQIKLDELRVSLDQLALHSTRQALNAIWPSDGHSNV